MRSEELHRLCFPSNVIRVINQGGWAGHVARAGERRGAVLCWEHLKEGDHLKELVVDGKNVRMALKGIGWEVVDWLC
jgi:hypothetical protein